MRRQRLRGLCYIVKNGPSVEFVVPTGWTVDKTSTVDKSPTVVNLPRETVDVSSPRTVDKTSTPLDNYTLSSQTTSALRPLLQAQLPIFDDAAVDQLWAECRKQVADVTAEEVSSLFAWKLPESRGRSIESPNGFLLRAVSRSCTPAAINAIRQRGREVAKVEQSPPPPSVEEQISRLENLLDALPHYESADKWRKELDELHALKHT